MGFFNLQGWKSMRHLMRSYGRLPVQFSHGAGAWLWDSKNNKYIDALCGIAVTGLGHSNPKINASIIDQVQKLTHVSNLYQIREQEELADKMCALSNMENVFFCNSGSEANEAAIKLARLFGHKKGILNPCIIVMENAWHGRTIATLSATGSLAAQQGFGPLVPGFLRVPFNNANKLNEAIGANRDVIAVMLEPVQGEAGIIIPSNDFLPKVRSICDKNGILMILDEVQTGMGRSGKWFSHQYAQISPDILTLAKGLGNGFPIGACLARGEASKLFSPGSHGSTFGGNPLGCAAAKVVFDVIAQDNLINRASTLGETISSNLRKELEGHKKIKEVRNQGLLIGIEMAVECSHLVTEALRENILLNVTGGNTIRLLPPLILSDQEAEIISEKVCKIINDFF